MGIIFYTSPSVAAHGVRCRYSWYGNLSLPVVWGFIVISNRGICRWCIDYITGISCTPENTPPARRTDARVLDKISATTVLG